MQDLAPFFNLFSTMSVVCALLLQLPPFRNSDPGSRSGRSSSLPATVHAVTLVREGISVFFP